MNIALKRVKFHEDMSDETNCFSADVWADGKKVATAQNQGCGGDTFVSPVDGRADPAFKAFEKHCLSLPPKRYKGEGYDFTSPSSPSEIVDDLFEEWLKGWYERKERQQIKRCEKCSPFLNL